MIYLNNTYIQGELYHHAKINNDYVTFKFFKDIILYSKFGSDQGYILHKKIKCVSDPMENIKELVERELIQFEYQFEFAYTIEKWLILKDFQDINLRNYKLNEFLQ